jgi:hypothetical protein
MNKLRYYVIQIIVLLIIVGGFISEVFLFNHILYLCWLILYRPGNMIIHNDISRWKINLYYSIAISFSILILEVFLIKVFFQRKAIFQTQQKRVE